MARAEGLHSQGASRFFVMENKFGEGDDYIDYVVRMSEERKSKEIEAKMKEEKRQRRNDRRNLLGLILALIAVIIALLNPLLERVWQAILLRYFDM